MSHFIKAVLNFTVIKRDIILSWLTPREMVKRPLKYIETGALFSRFFVSQSHIQISYPHPISPNRYIQEIQETVNLFVMSAYKETLSTLESQNSSKKTNNLRKKPNRVSLYALLAALTLATVGSHPVAAISRASDASQWPTAGLKRSHPQPATKQDPSWQEGSVQLLTITKDQGGHNRPVRAVAFHPENRFFATGSADNSVIIWDLQQQSKVKVFSQDSDILSLDFSPDGYWLAIGNFDGTVQIWDWQMAQLAHTFSDHNNAVTAVQFTHDGEHLVSASGDRHIKVWDVKTGENVASMETGQWIESMALDPQSTGKVAISGLGRKVEIWNLATQKREQTSERLPSSVYSVDWHPRRQQLALSPNSNANSNLENNEGDHNSVTLFNLDSARLGDLLNGHSDYISFVAFSPSGDTLLSGSWDHTIRLWNPQTGELIRSFLENEKRILSGDFSDNGKAFIIGSGDGSIKVYRTQE